MVQDQFFDLSIINIKRNLVYIIKLEDILNEFTIFDWRLTL